MTSDSPDRLDRIESLLERSIQASDERMTQTEQRLDESVQRSDERMTRLEQQLDESARRSDERMARLEQQLDESARRSDERLTRIEQAVESNNRFLSAFSHDLRGYVQTMDNLAQRFDSIIAATNQDRDETNTRLASIQRRVSAIARHLGVE